MEVRVGTEWKFTNPTGEHTRCLIVEWYFEILIVTVSLPPLNDYRRIRAHAEECLDRVVGQTGPSPRTYGGSTVFDSSCIHLRRKRQERLSRDRRRPRQPRRLREPQCRRIQHHHTTEVNDVVFTARHPRAGPSPSVHSSISPTCPRGLPDGDDAERRRFLSSEPVWTYRVRRGTSATSAAEATPSSPYSPDRQPGGGRVLAFQESSV
jgi:hypothetical protein